MDKKDYMSRKALQIAMACIGIFAICTGLLGFMGLANPLYSQIPVPASAPLDSNLRFLCGLWLGVGVTSICLIPHIERHTVPFRIVWGMILLGGVGRSLSIYALPQSPPWLIVLTMVEILGAFVFMYWQWSVAASYSQPD